jgi:cephalosporin hydroxylase
MLYDTDMQKNKFLVLCLAILGIAGVTFVSGIPGEKPQSREEVIAEFTKLYYASNVHYRTKWLGVPSLQNPCDMWVLQEIVSEIKPDFIVETGTFKGGGALFLATILRLANENGRILTVDIKPQVEQASRYAIFNDAVEVFTGSSVSEDIVKAIAKKVEGARVMVTLDSDHSKSHVLRELEIYSQFVSIGSYLVVQDTAHNGHPLPTDYEGGGPMEAVREFLAKHRNFAPDRTREKFLLTFFPQGYLKRLS